MIANRHRMVTWAPSMSRRRPAWCAWGQPWARRGCPHEVVVRRAIGSAHAEAYDRRRSSGADARQGPTGHARRRWLDLRAQVGRVPDDRRDRHRRHRAPRESRRQTPGTVLPGVARAAGTRCEPRTVRGRRRDRAGGAGPDGLRRTAAAAASCRVAGAQARRRDPRHLDRVRPAVARGRRARRGPARRTARATRDAGLGDGMGGRARFPGRRAHRAHGAGRSLDRRSGGGARLVRRRRGHRPGRHHRQTCRAAVPVGRTRLDQGEAPLHARLRRGRLPPVEDRGRDRRAVARPVRRRRHAPLRRAHVLVQGEGATGHPRAVATARRRRQLRGWSRAGRAEPVERRQGHRVDHPATGAGVRGHDRPGAVRAVPPRRELRPLARRPRARELHLRPDPGGRAARVARTDRTARPNPALFRSRPWPRPWPRPWLPWPRSPPRPWRFISSHSAIFFAREGFTRTGSSSPFGKCGGHGASPRPPAASCSASASNASRRAHVLVDAGTRIAESPATGRARCAP